ncbi:hypothetical protein, partial [Actinophytocola sediminis]
MSARIGRWARAAMVVLIAAAPAVGSAVLPGGSAQAQQLFAAEETKEIVNARTGARRDATVRVSRTTGLFNRQQILVDLAGFVPTWSAMRTENTGVNMEYPVVVMQCRGDQPTPQTCLNERRSVWYPGYDTAASPDLASRARQVRSPGSVVGFPGETFSAQKAAAIRVEQLGFEAADGIQYLWEGTTHQDTGAPLIDEPKLKSFPPTDTADSGTSMVATRSVAIREDGTNQFLFEVRQRVSQPSLGCTDTQACSIVVVPIMDMACAPDAPADCGGDPKGAAPGEPGGSAVNDFLGPRTWFAPSNWQNRYVVPISFAPDPATCSVFDQRPPAPVFGSELVDVAQQRWGSAYCAGTRPADYLPLYTQGSEYEARRQFTSKLGPKYRQDAIVTSQPVTDSPRPVVHAPSAVTGFAVAFAVDDVNGRQVEQLTLSPRLLAKLITQSYSPGRVLDTIRDSRTYYTGQPVSSSADAAKYYWEHPTIARNPRSVFEDQEFRDLNPDIDLLNRVGAVDVRFTGAPPQVIFQVQSDVMVELTRYVVSDPAARTWLDGTPDEQGMVVNPVWRGTGSFEAHSLRDQVVRPPRPRATTWSETQPTRLLIPGAGDDCDEVFGTAMLTRLANITNSVETAALALLDRRGSATPACSATDIPVPQPAPGQPPLTPQYPGDNVHQNRTWSEAKVPPADFGKRTMLSVTSVPHARLYEVPVARLVNASGDAVAPTTGTMVTALMAAVQDRTTGTIQLDHERVTGGDAYPGTMVAFTAAPTRGLDAATADNYADFIEFMATDGQRPGDGFTNLPPGYDPLTPNLRQQALDAARAVREQRGEVP